MGYTLDYGHHTITVDLPDAPLNVLSAAGTGNTRSEQAVISEALQHPIGSSRLADTVGSGDEVVVIISDLTRLWVRQHVFLPPIIESLLEGGVHPERITLLAATGDHRGHTREEWARLIGNGLPEGIRCVDHDARSEDQMVFCAATSRGTPVRINRLVLEADRVICTGGIVYHFLSGFSGGMKALVPGVAGYETIMANHSLALSPSGGVNPEVVAGTMDGNPCSEDIWEGGSLVKPDFLFNVIVDDDTHRITHAFAGDPREAHIEGRRMAQTCWEVPIASRAPVVFASAGGYPKDINLYQTYKTLYNAARAVTPGGTIVITARCAEGMGNDDFAKVLLDLNDNSEREAAVRRRFSIGGYMAYHMAILATRYRVVLVSDLCPSAVEKSGMIPAPHLHGAVERVRESHGNRFDYFLMPTGSAFPVLENEKGEQL